jgi:hypothetical protein
MKMTIKVLFSLGCSCKEKKHEVIFEFKSVDDFKEHEIDDDKRRYILTCAQLYFPTDAGCEFNNEINAKVIESEVYDYSFASMKEWDGKIKEEKEEEEIPSPVSNSVLDNLITIRLFDDLERDIFVQFKDKNILKKHADNNFSDILDELNKHFWEEYDYKQPTNTILKYEYINEIHHLYIQE